MESPVNLSFIPVALVFAALDFQVKNPEVNDDKDDNKKIDANSITRWSARDNGQMIIATTPDAFPAFDKTTERLEVINIGKNLVGDKVFLATIQNSGKNLDNSNAQFEAKAFDLVLPESGSHFGTSAHADTTLDTTGHIYVLNKDGKLKEQMKIPDMKKAFLAGAFDGKIMVAIETKDLFGILDAMTLVDRARNSGSLLIKGEGKVKQDGETLTRAELDEMSVMAVVKNGKVSYFDREGTLLEKADDQKADIIRFPGVDNRGRQVPNKRVTVTRTGETSGMTERNAIGQ